MKVHSFDKIRRLKMLRSRGYSIMELTRELSMPKTTVWHHVQKISLTPRSHAILKSKQGGSKNKSLLEWEKARNEAEKMFLKLGAFEKILIAASLYWGEGSKGDFSLSNTDPYLISTFLSCLKVLDVKKDELAIGIRIYEDIDRRKAINFWAKVIGVTADKIRHINVLKGKKKGKLLYGMCRIRVVKSGYLLKFLTSIREIIIKRLCPCSSMDRAPHS